MGCPTLGCRSRIRIPPRDGPPTAHGAEARRNGARTDDDPRGDGTRPRWLAALVGAWLIVAVALILVLSLASAARDDAPRFAEELARRASEPRLADLYTLTQHVTDGRDLFHAREVVRRMGARAGPLLCQFAETQDDAGARAWIMASLGDVGDRDALPHVLAGLADGHPLVREQALWALTRLCARCPDLPLPPGLQDELAPVGRGEAWPAATREEIIARALRRSPAADSWWDR